MLYIHSRNDIELQNIETSNIENCRKHVEIAPGISTGAFINWHELWIYFEATASERKMIGQERIKH